MTYPNEAFIEQLESILAVLTGRSGGQIFHGGKLTGETLDLLNNLIDQLGIHINGDGTVDIDRDTTIGQTDVAGIVEVKDAAGIVKAKLNAVNPSFFEGIQNNGNLATAHRSITTATANLNSTDHFIYIDYTTMGAADFSLIASQTYDGRVIHILDSGDNASVNNITVTPAAGDTIQEATSLIINGDSEGYSLRYRASNHNWRIF